MFHVWGSADGGMRTYGLRGFESRQSQQKIPMGKYFVGTACGIRTRDFQDENLMS